MSVCINEEYVRKALQAHPELYHKRTVEVALGVVVGKPCVARVNARACDTPSTRFFGRFLRDNYPELASNLTILGDFYMPHTSDPFEELMRASKDWDKHRVDTLALKSGPGGWHRHGLRFLQKISTVDSTSNDEKNEQHAGLEKAVDDDQAPPPAPPAEPPPAPQPLYLQQKLPSWSKIKINQPPCSNFPDARGNQSLVWSNF